MARVVVGYGPNQKTSARLSSGFVFRTGSILLGKLRTDVETAGAPNEWTWKAQAASSGFYEEGLHGYTYLEG